MSEKRKFFLRPNTKDHETFEEIFKNNLYQISLPFNPERIIDAGANTGLAAIFFKLKYKNVKIASIEIEKGNIEMLKKNLVGDSFKIYEHALYNRKAYFKVEDPFHATNSFVIKEVNQGEKYDISSVTIDEIMQENHWDYVDILKIDIEGSEKDLFASDYQSWLPKMKVVLIETHDRMIPGCAITVINAMESCGFILHNTKEGTLIFYSKEVMAMFPH